MKRLLALALLAGSLCFAQQYGAYPYMTFGSQDPPHCTPDLPYFHWRTDLGVWRYCRGVDAWTTVLRAGNVSLTSDVVGQLPASKGGTGTNNTATAGRYLKGDGTGFVTSTGSASGTGACTNQVVTGLNSDAAPTCSSIAPVWVKYSVAKIANGVSGCATANGCWRVNSDAPVAASAALTQDIVLYQLPANGSLDQLRVKTSTACAGAATIRVTDFGLTGTAGYYATGLTYNLTAVVAATNLLTPAMAASGSNTTAATNITVRVTTTVSNVDQIGAGCAFDVWALSGALP